VSARLTFRVVRAAIITHPPREIVARPPGGTPGATADTRPAAAASARDDALRPATPGVGGKMSGWFTVPILSWCTKDVGPLFSLNNDLVAHPVHLGLRQLRPTHPATWAAVTVEVAVKTLKSLSILFVASWLILAGPASGNAILTVSDGTTTQTDSNSDPLHQLAVTFTSGGTTWNISGTGSNNGLASIPALSLLVSGSTTSTGGSLHIMYQVDGFDLGNSLGELFSGLMNANPPNAGFFTWGFCVAGVCVNPPLDGDPSGITLTSLNVDLTGPFSIILFETLEPGTTSYTNSLYVSRGAIAVPEPGTLLLIGVAVLAIVLARRRTH